MSTAHVGVWSAEALFRMGSTSDEILVFNRDGTGWIERIYYQDWSADFFEWTPTSPGWMAFAFTKHIEPHQYTRKVVESVATLPVEHTAFEVREECAPSGAEMPVLHIQIFDDGHEMYGLVSADPQTRPEPTGRMLLLET